MTFFLAVVSILATKEISMKILLFCFAISFFDIFFVEQFAYAESENTTPRQFLEKIKKQVESETPLLNLCSIDIPSINKVFSQMPIEGTYSSMPSDKREEIIQESFKTRLLLRNRLKYFNVDTPAQKKCFSDVRTLTRNLRYLEDYAIEAQVPKTATMSDYKTLSGNGAYFLKTADSKIFDAYSLQSGDIILSRGNAFSSAMSGAMTKDPNQFSHISVAYRDKENKLWVIETMLEGGTQLRYMFKHVDDMNARTVVFRYKDQAVAHKSADYIFNIVKAKQDLKENIPYDFPMNLGDDAKNLYCSEVAYQGFLGSSHISIPKVKGQFIENLLPILTRFGLKLDEKTVKTFHLFSPGDIEYDPDFSLVAEWRNPLKTKRSRLLDILMEKEVEWMSEKNYIFDEKISTDVYSLAWKKKSITR